MEPKMQNMEGIEAKNGTIDAKYEVQIQNKEGRSRI
jgi:hypothetical protein